MDKSEFFKQTAQKAREHACHFLDETKKLGVSNPTDCIAIATGLLHASAAIIISTQEMIGNRDEKFIELFISFFRDAYQDLYKQLPEFREFADEIMKEFEEHMRTKYGEKRS